MYLLDTNHCSRVIQGEPSVIRRLEQAGDVFVGTCAVVAGELQFMGQKSTEKEKNLYIINGFLKNIKIYPIDNFVAEIYGDFKFSLYEHFGPRDRSKRTQTEIHKLGFSENDLWIAATAKRNDLIIVSSDSDFIRMKEVLDISIESWYNPV
jgi:tRNA(fMet)-specific endonuclease VapC